MGYYGLGGGHGASERGRQDPEDPEGGGDSGEPFGQRSCGANIFAVITKSVP